MIQNIVKLCGAVMTSKVVADIQSSIGDNVLSIPEKNLVSRLEMIAKFHAKESEQFLADLWTITTIIAYQNKISQFETRESLSQYEQFEECKPFTEAYKKQVTECLDKMAEQDKEKNKEKNEQRDIETKMVIGAFIGSCQQYFVDVHIHRNILPNDYEQVDHRIGDLLELYEKKLPYLMRNTDCKFKIVSRAERKIISNPMTLEYHDLISKILNPNDDNYCESHIELINEFIDCITESWRDFKKEYKAQQEQLRQKVDCPQGRNGYQCVKTAASCLDPKCPEYKTFGGRSGVRTFGKDWTRKGADKND